MRPLAPAELALAEVTARLERQLRVQSQQKVAAFERAMLDLEAAEAAALAAVAQQREEAAAAQAAAEAAAEQQRAAQRSQLLTGLRSQHQAKAKEGERKVQQLEAAVRQQAEAAAAAAAAAAKADQDRRAAADAAAQAERQRAAAAAEQAAAADKAAAEAAAAKAEQKKAAVAAAAAQASGLRVAPSAAEWEKQCAEALAAAQVGKVGLAGLLVSHVGGHCLLGGQHDLLLLAATVSPTSCAAKHACSPGPCRIMLPPRATRPRSSRLWGTARCATRSAPLTSLSRSTCSRSARRWSRCALREGQVESS